MKLLSKSLGEIKPTQNEERHLSNVVSEFLEKLNSSLSSGKAVVGGSAAKGTWLRNKYDVDVFVVYDYKIFSGKSDSLSEILAKDVVKKFPKAERLHGSRDYFKINFKGFEFEVVPVLNIKNAKMAKNITDVSLLHAKWVMKHKKIADDIRLLKQFCKSANVYGAESYIRGFSGYICEILVIYYGSFLDALKAGAKWNGKVILDVENHYKGKNPLLFLNESKILSPIVIIDPVQMERNAAAAISPEKFEIFVLRCRDFLKNPSEKFFQVKNLSLEEIKKTAGKNRLCIFIAEPYEGKIDVIGSKLLKVFEHISQIFSDEDFAVNKSGWEWKRDSQAIFYFVFSGKNLPDIKIHQGPELRLEEHVLKFKKMHKNTYVKNRRIYAKINRKHTSPESLAREIIKDEYVLERVRKINLIKWKK